MSPLSSRDDSTSSKPISANAWIARDAASRSSLQSRVASWMDVCRSVALVVVIAFSLVPLVLVLRVLVLRGLVLTG